MKSCAITAATETERAYGALIYCIFKFIFIDRAIKYHNILPQVTWPTAGLVNWTAIRGQGVGPDTTLKTFYSVPTLTRQCFSYGLTESLNFKFSLTPLGLDVIFVNVSSATIAYTSWHIPLILFILGHPDSACWIVGGYNCHQSPSLLVVCLITICQLPTFCKKARHNEPLCMSLCLQARTVWQMDCGARGQSLYWREGILAGERGAVQWHHNM